MGPTQFDIKDSIAVITLNSPPVNGLGHALRTAIVEGIQNAQSNNGIHAIVITGTEKAFSGGADIKEFGTSMAIAEPHLHTLIHLLETCTKPVVADRKSTRLNSSH